MWICIRERVVFYLYYTGQATVFVQKVPVWGPYIEVFNTDATVVFVNEKVVLSWRIGPSGVNVFILGYPSLSIILGETPV